VVAGVAAGIGDYFGIDPVIVRIGFVVLTIFGGSGILLYLIAWLVIAKEGEGESAAGRALKGSDRPRGRGVVAVLLILAAVFMISGPVLWLADFGFGGEDLFFPLLLIAAGVALLLWPDDGDWSAPRQPEAREETTTPGETPPPIPVTSTELVVRRDAIAELDDDDTMVTWSEEPPAPPLFDDTPAPAHRPEDSEESARRSFPITSLTLAVLLVMTGAAVLLDRLDVLDVRPVTFLATALVVVGIGLVASAFVGRARGLIVLGLSILPILWFAHVVDIRWWAGVGDETVVVNDLDELESAYHHGIGQLIVDLGDLDLAGETVELEVGLTIGNLEVLVPDGVEVDVELDGRIGQVVVERPGRDLVDDGLDVAVDTTLPGDEGRLLLDVDLGIGEARVAVAS
jgi:phage shock protein PspC (stress-responsive transcriptional regulator)